MASIRKSGKKWRAEVHINQVRKSKSFNSKIEAMAWAVESEQFLSKNGGLVLGKTLGDAYRRYIDEVAPSKKGQRAEIVRLNKLARQSIAEIQLQDLSAEDLSGWVAESLTRIQSSSVNRELNIINSVLEVARKQWRWLGVNPLKDLDRPKDPPPRDRRISDSEVERVLDSLLFDESEPVETQRGFIAVAFLLALETAMRQGELWGLDWDDVFLDDCFVRLHDTKNGSKRDVPLSKRAVELFRLIDGGGRVFPYNQESCGQIFRSALKLAEITDLTFHDTRHEALTRLARKIDMLDLARMVGHRDPRSLMIYYNATASEIASRLD